MASAEHPKKKARGRETQHEVSHLGLPIVGCVTLNESLPLSGLLPDKEKLESLPK